MALGLVVAGAILVGPTLTIEQRAAGLSAVAATVLLAGRLSGRRRS